MNGLPLDITQLVRNGKGANPPLPGTAGSLLLSGDTGFFDLLAGLMLGSESDRLSGAIPRTDGLWPQQLPQSDMLIGSYVSTTDGSPDELVRALPTAFPIPSVDIPECMKGITDCRPANDIPLEPTPSPDRPEGVKGTVEGQPVEKVPLELVPCLNLPESTENIVDGRPVENIPLQLVVSPDESAQAQMVDPAIRELFESISATLQIIPETDTQATSEPNETEPNSFLRLETADVSLAIPVEIAVDEGKSILVPKPTVGVADVTIPKFTGAETVSPQQLRMEFAGNRNITLTGTIQQAIEESIPQEKLHEIVSRPEITVRQVVVISEPVKFLKQFMPELVLPDQQQNALSQQPNERVASATVIPVGNEFVTTDDGSGDQGHNRFADSRGDAERRTETRILQPDRLDVQRLVRETDRTVGSFEKNADKLSLKEYETRPLDLLPKQNPSPQTVNQTAIGLKGYNQKVFIEPVRFNVHLPDSGLKITEVSSFKVSLKPEALGNVKVHLIMVDNQLTARLSVESTAARQAVEANLPILKDTLEQHGIRAENFSVDIANGGNPNRQRNSRRDAPQVKQSVEEFSLDGDMPAPISIEAMRVASGGNLMGTLNLVA